MKEENLYFNGLWLFLEVTDLRLPPTASTPRHILKAEAPLVVWKKVNSKLIQKANIHIQKNIYTYIHIRYINVLYSYMNSTTLNLWKKGHIRPH